MDKKLIFAAILSAALCLPLLSQTTFEYSLTKHKGNKIVLLGPKRPEDTAKWRQIIDADGIFEHGFILLNSENASTNNTDVTQNPDGTITRDRGIDAEGFEAWLRQRYGLSASARWVALDLGNKPIDSGVQMPSAKEFEQMLDRRGTKSPLRQVRDFLRENPDHIDAMTDLLKEVRRRALHVMPPNTNEDLGTEADLRTWGVLAAETDRVFNGNWLGVDLDFFRSDRSQPERFSKLMRVSFAKHISKLESALRLEPANATLWNIWAWMARSMPDYRWDTFINSFEPVLFYKNRFYKVYSAPSPDVCVWLLDAARAKKDWGTVIKYAKVAKLAGMNMVESMGFWMPGGAMQAMRSVAMEGYPEKSAFAPHLEALLRLGDIDGANNVFDEMMRLKCDASIAAGVAKSVGMEDLAKQWQKGEIINKAPYASDMLSPGFVNFWVHNNAGNNYSRQFTELIRKLSSNYRINTLGASSLTSLGWNSNDDSKWALTGDDGRVLIQDTTIPDVDAIQAILRRFNILGEKEMLQKYIADHGSAPGLELQMVFDFLLKRTPNNAAPMDDDKDGAVLREAAGYLYKALREYPDLLINLPTVYRSEFPINSASMKSLSKPLLAKIESLIEKKPSSDALWNQWVIWEKFEGEDRPIEPIVERAKLSPLSPAGMVPPVFVISTYYEECIKNGKWQKVIGLLKTAWDREFEKASKDIGDMLGIPLIEAYLQDGRAREADEIFNAVLEVGSTFADISKIVALAKEKGQDRLAREWEGKIKK